MSSIIQTLKEILGDNLGQFDFVYPIVASILLIYVSGTVLRVFGYILGGMKK